MDKIVQTHLEGIRSKDRYVQREAYFKLIELTNTPVDWAYEVWDEMVEDLTHQDNHRRAIASQILSNLAKSDPDDRVLRDFDALMAVTRDKMFVTSRHSLQSIWKIGVGGEVQRKKLINALIERFKECGTEKNSTLIRYDIIQGLKHLYDAVPDETIRETALGLIELEEDIKYRKKYAKVWR